jgi:hypothetical protein
MSDETERGELAMSFLSDKQRRVDIRRIPPITGLADSASRDAPALLMQKALGVLDERGWTKVRFTNRRGNVCLLGALRVADGGQARWPYHRSPAYRQAVARLNRLAQERGHNRATFFNDDLGTGYQDVIQFVQQAISQHGNEPEVPRHDEG